jgi:hypothetical protein
VDEIDGEGIGVWRVGTGVEACLKVLQDLGIGAGVVGVRVLGKTEGSEVYEVLR